MDGLSSKKQKAILALLTEPTIAKAAESVAVTERTLYLWLADDEFSSAYRKARRDFLRNAVTRVQRETETAVKVLVEVMNDPKASASVRVAAARTIIETALRATEIEDLEARIFTLERRLNHESGKAGSFSRIDDYGQ